MRDGGPVLYVDKRPGRDGKPFGCLKFRTMSVDADARLRALLESDPAARDEFRRMAKLRHDPRITRIGAFLRRTSLDELPQFINCLKGEMSVVGPRPRQMCELDWGAKFGPAFYNVFSVRPGLTGPWQIAGRSRLSCAHRWTMDATYVRNWSLLGDLMIVLRTIPSVLRQDGAT